MKNQQIITLFPTVVYSCEMNRNFSDKEKIMLTKATKKADEYFLKMKDIPYIDKYKLANMNWNFSKTLRRDYEAGYPHTRENIIFITDEVIRHHELTRIMIHEKIHVFELNS